MDYDGKRYKSRKQYILQRILKGSDDGTIDGADIMSAKYIFFDFFIFIRTRKAKNKWMGMVILSRIESSGFDKIHDPSQYE